MILYNKSTMKNRVAMIGMGTMGKAITNAILKHGRKIKIITINKEDSSITAHTKIKDTEYIIIAVKPQNAATALIKIKSEINKNTIVISIMAGVSIRRIAQLTGHKKILRMMPNLGLSVGEGIAVWKSAGLSKIEIKKTKSFIEKITENFEVKDEDMIDRISTISGCGPAYFFLFADSLLVACDKLGLNKNESKLLVEKTFSASALLGKEADYSELIKKVASKGGVTEAALKVFKKKNFNKIVITAVQAAYKRTQEL